MALLIEDPTAVLIVSGLVIVGLLISFFQTGRGLYLLWIGAVLLVTLLFLLVERYVVTDRERVEDTLFGAAEALKANDLEGTLSYLSPGAIQLQGEVRGQMRMTEFQDAEISDLAIEFSPEEDPPLATANFLGRIDFKDAKIPLERVVRRVTVRLVREGDRWLINSFELNEPQLLR